MDLAPNLKIDDLTYFDVKWQKQNTILKFHNKVYYITQGLSESATAKSLLEKLRTLMVIEQNAGYQRRKWKHLGIMANSQAHTAIWAVEDWANHKIYN